MEIEAKLCRYLIIDLGHSTYIPNAIPLNGHFLADLSFWPNVSQDTTKQISVNLMTDITAPFSPSGRIYRFL